MKASVRYAVTFKRGDRTVSEIVWTRGGAARAAITARQRLQDTDPYMWLEGTATVTEEPSKESCT